MSPRLIRAPAPHGLDSDAFDHSVIMVGTRAPRSVSTEAGRRDVWRGLRELVTWPVRHTVVETGRGAKCGDAELALQAVCEGLARQAMTVGRLIFRAAGAEYNSGL